jgi:hypothetical protein
MHMRTGLRLSSSPWAKDQGQPGKEGERNRNRKLEAYSTGYVDYVVSIVHVRPWLVGSRFLREVDLSRQKREESSSTKQSSDSIRGRAE